VIGQKPRADFSSYNYVYRATHVNMKLNAGTLYFSPKSSQSHIANKYSNDISIKGQNPLNDD